MNPVRALIRFSLLWMGLALFLAITPAYANGMQAPLPDSPLVRMITQAPSPFGAYEIDKEALFQLYQLRKFAPAWDTQSENSRKANADFLESLKNFVAYHGLDETQLPFSQMASLIEEPDAPDAAEKLEILMTDSLIKLARRINGEDVSLAYIYTGWEFERPSRNIVSELAASINDNLLNEYFAAQAPQDVDYKLLATALKSYRELEGKGAWPVIAAGEIIRAGDSDPRLPVIQARLEAEGYTFPPRRTGESPQLLTAAFQDVIITYQARNMLEADGNIGAKTLTAMNKSLDSRIGQITANMERKRHMPRVFPARYAIVNIAGTSVKVIDNGQVVYHEPVIVGRVDRKTPFIQSEIRSVIFNPSWHVPAKIAREDILPKLRKDPHYLEKMGFVINGSADDPHGSMIDWNEIDKSEFNFRLRQSPGDLNSLGRIKFDFDNRFAVYMHGTPHEELFAKVDRHLSSGCIRLKDPEAFAAIVLADNEGEWTEERAQGEIDKRKTHWLKVATPLPLYIVYESAFFPTPDSPIHFAPDRYNYDRLLLDALKNEES